MNEPPLTREPSCADSFEPGLLPAEEAVERILADIRPVPSIERMPIRSALGRVTAEHAISRLNVPSHTNSAVDGYALNGAELPADPEKTFKLAGTALAGKPWRGDLQAGDCVRIMTGAPMPPGADTVIMQEHVTIVGEGIRIGPGHKPGQNVRHAGEDIREGDVAVPAGTRITPAELGVLASTGRSEISVYRRVRVAFFSTGDELRALGEPIEEGEVYDSNRYTLYGMLHRLGVDLIDMGVVRDRPEDIGLAFRQACESADAIITSGGVSVGEADHVKSVLDDLGQVAFWKIAIKPGRPLAFGRIMDKPFFGLPGNPVAVMVTFYQFVQPALRRMKGERTVRPLRLKVPCASGLKKKPGRTEFVRAALKTDAEGKTVAEKTGFQGSGILSSMSRADCFIVLPPDCNGIEPGEMVEVELFHGLV